MRHEARTCTMHTIMGGKAGMQRMHGESKYMRTGQGARTVKACTWSHTSMRGKACAWVKSCRHSGKGFENSVS